ncbi:hypothetical protein, partial [Dyella sedimenti]|uniref:hypothetical protein n=1 Tax=Dyella sedimenti TaxID=2919947 RepID=UPI001FA986D9
GPCCNFATREPAFNPVLLAALNRIEELLDIHAKHHAQLAQDQQGRIADRTLDLADIGPINIGAKRQFFLGQLPLIPKRTDVLRQNFSDLVETPCHKGTVPLARASIHGIYSTKSAAPRASPFGM